MTNRKAFISGMRDGIPIALGYLAVAFAVGIAAHRAGIGVLEATVMSFLNVTSAGEAAAIDLIAAGTTVLEMALTQFVINMRYMLMSCALSQRIAPDTPLAHRFFVSFGITDEIFGICATGSGNLNPFYAYGAFLVTIPAWALGTLLGAAVGSILPTMVTGALGVCLYGMFIAIVVPPAKKNRAIAVICLITMALSWLMRALPLLCNIPTGFRIILITLSISAIAAVFVPLPDQNEEQEERSV